MTTSIGDIQADWNTFGSIYFGLLFFCVTRVSIFLPCNSPHHQLFLQLYCSSFPVPLGTYLPLAALGAAIGRATGEFVNYLVPGGNFFYPHLSSSNVIRGTGPSCLCIGWRCGSPRYLFPSFHFILPFSLSRHRLSSIQPQPPTLCLLPLSYWKSQEPPLRLPWFSYPFPVFFALLSYLETATIVSYYMSKIWYPSIYDINIKYTDLPYLPDLKARYLSFFFTRIDSLTLRRYRIKAKHIMEPASSFITRASSLREIRFFLFRYFSKSLTLYI